MNECSGISSDATAEHSCMTTGKWLLLLLLLTIPSVAAAPLIDFSSPTPSDHGIVPAGSVVMNVSLTEATLARITTVFDSTSEDVFDNDVRALLSFNNNSALGETATV